MPCLSNSRNTPTCAHPRAIPPPSARPINGLFFSFFLSFFAIRASRFEISSTHWGIAGRILAEGARPSRANNAPSQIYLYTGGVPRVSKWFSDIRPLAYARGTAPWRDTADVSERMIRCPGACVRAVTYRDYNQAKKSNGYFKLDRQ